jgi:hypothetical protein
MVRRSLCRSVALMWAGLFLVSGCSSDLSTADAKATPLSAAGPWAQEFGEALAEASDYEEAVLQDGRITSAELADAQARDRACMRDAGYDLQDADDGTSSVSRLDGQDLPATDVVNAVKQRCAARFDRSITFLYNEVRRNPEKQDDAKITADCLRRSGIVDKGYTERQWRAENDTGQFSFNDYDPAAVQCRLDPLGLWRDG